MLGVVSLGGAIAAVLVLRSAVTAYVIRSGSMDPTLRVGDRVLVSRFHYQFTSPKRGDVVVFADPRDGGATGERRLAAGQPNVRRRMLSRRRRVLIKRVVAVAGDAVWAGRVARTRRGPLQVPQGSVFVVGDDLERSRDSRSFGPVDVAEVVGRAVVIVWPPVRIGVITGSSTQLHRYRKDVAG